MTKLPIIDKLKADLAKVERELKIEVPKELKKAADHGDLSENAEYDAAKERQSFLQARAGHLHQRISTLTSLDIDKLPRDKAAFGSKVTLENCNNGEPVTYELVTPEEVDPRNGKISVSSPIGKALLNKCADDEVTIQLPSGTKEYVVIELQTIHDLLES